MGKSIVFQSTPREPINDPPLPGKPSVPEHDPVTPDPYPVRDPVQPPANPDPEPGPAPRHDPEPFPGPPEPIPEFPPDVTFRA